MSRSKALKAALAKASGGVFYLAGNDEFRKEEATRAIVEAHLDPSTRDFNFDLVRGSQTDFESLAVLLGTPPMMADWRVILLRETQALVASQKMRELLLSTAASPPPGLTLILLCTPPEKSTAQFYKEIAKVATSFDFPLPNPNDLPAWVMQLAQESFSRTITEDAARALVQAIGTTTGILAQEVEKLATLTAEGEEITRATVEAAGTKVPRQDRWQWFDLVGEKRFPEAIEGLKILLEHGETGVGLVIGAATHLLRIGAAVEGGARGLEGSLPANQKWLARKYVDHARKWSSEEVTRALSGLLKVDELLKASRLGEEHLLEGWLLELAAREAIAA